MKLTNRHELPAPLVAAIENDAYDRGDCDFTVTQLYNPPQIEGLRRQHADELEEDASEAIYRLLGQATHTILERAPDVDHALREKRLYIDIEVDGVMYRLGGMFDRAVLTGAGTLQDYKVTSVYAVADGSKPDWDWQLNMNAVLLEANGYAKPEQLEIVAILRDWGPRMVGRPGVPKVAVKVVPVRLWSTERTLEKARELVRDHVKAREGKWRPCTDEERWARGDRWAVMKHGRKTAVKLFDSEVAANTHAGDLPAGHFVERRPAEAKRCQQYCPVSKFCPQWRAMQ